MVTATPTDLLVGTSGREQTTSRSAAPTLPLPATALTGNRSHHSTPSRTGGPASAHLGSRALHLPEPHLPLGRLHRRRAERETEAACLPQLRVQPGDELTFTHRLGHVVVGARVEPAGHACLVVAPADEDDGQVRILRPQFAAN